MANREITMFCMSQTPWKPDFTFDEAAMRAHVRRLVDARMAMYLGSPGSGEGHSISPKEHRILYETAVDEAKGRVPVYANPREGRTAAAMLEVAREAQAAKVDAVQFYQLDMGHEMMPTEDEQAAYWRDILEVFQHPTTISIHAGAGYRPSVAFVAELCRRYEQIIAINVMEGSVHANLPQIHAFFMRLREALPARVKLYTSIGSVMQMLPVGADGCLSSPSNAFPRIVRGIADGYLEGDMKKVESCLTMIQKASSAIGEAAGAMGASRGQKAALKVLGLGNGVMRKPWLTPPQERLDKLKADFDKLGVWALEQSLGAVPAGR